MEKPHNFSAGRTVKVAGRFVRQNDGWVRGYGARNSSALLLAAGELAWKVMHAFGKANFIQRLFGEFPPPCAGKAAVAERQFYIFKCS